MTQDEARRAIEALISIWGGRDNAAAMKRVAAIVTAEEVHNAGSNARFTRAWLDGHRDLSPETIAAISGMVTAFSELHSNL